MKCKSYLLSFAKAKGSIAAALVAVLMAANTTVALAQNKATESNGTENTIEGVDNLFGIDPSSKICTSNGRLKPTEIRLCFFITSVRRSF